ncbi:AAA family ATPase [Streptomyces sp. JV184]|uniref:AAA family ATPase n=1 Tax=Streptomyces sp. JV184 TaxID=858637 RepID=UPI002E75F724|nr:AAA family ATPase [Streptomyces sp. JV184]MEE1745245.1 hypothetical protein [Streptomyces sp. JV184]
MADHGDGAGALTSLIGRRAETARIAGLLSGARLVTLTGVGGGGKTRLALRVASDVAGSFPDGVHVAELADPRDPELLATSVLGTLDVARPGRPGADATAALVARLGERRVLLVLDNCEHLVDACARLADTLLRCAPRAACAGDEPAAAQDRGRAGLSGGAAARAGGG